MTDIQLNDDGLVVMLSGVEAWRARTLLFPKGTHPKRSLRNYAGSTGLVSHSLAVTQFLSSEGSGVGFPKQNIRSVSNKAVGENTQQRR